MNEYGWFPVKVYIQKQATSQIWLTGHSSMVIRGRTVASLSISIFSVDVVSPGNKKKNLLISCLRVFESYVDISLLSSKNLDSLMFVFFMGKALTCESLVTRVFTWLSHPGPSHELLPWRSYALQQSANTLVTGFSFLSFPYWGITSICLSPFKDWMTHLIHCHPLFHSPFLSRFIKFSLPSLSFWWSFRREPEISRHTQLYLPRGMWVLCIK